MDDLQSVLLEQLKDSTIQFAFILGTLFLLGKRLKAQPTQKSLWLIVLPVPLLALSFGWPALTKLITLLVMLYTPALLLLMMTDGFLLSVQSHRISLSRMVSEKLSIGQDNPVQISLINNSEQTLHGALYDSIPTELLANGQVPAVFDAPITLNPFSHQTVQYEICPTQRGIYRLERVHFRYKSRLGLLWLTLKNGRPENIKVVPDMRRIRRLRIQASKALTPGELHKRSLGLEGTQFSGLRHYLPGDDIKKMAWQATAKLDLPVVRTFEPEVEQPILVLLDAGRKMDSLVKAPDGPALSKYDWAMNTALAFMAVATDRGDAVGVGVFSNRIVAQLPIGTGQAHWNQILETLSETKVESVEPDYEAVLLQFARNLKRRTLVVLLTDLIDPVASRALLRGLQSFSNNHMLMVATLSDAETSQKALALPDSAYEAYQKGVALDLLELRRQALMALSKTHRALVVDAPPEKLDEALVQRYLQLKQQNKL